MRIEAYSFGSIVIDGRTYRSDVIIYPDRIDEGWWRAEGHLLQLSDIQDILDAEPEALVVGTGFSARMQVAPEVERELEGRGIELIAVPTGDAWNTFNEVQASRRTVAALHLTC